MFPSHVGVTSTVSSTLPGFVLVLVNTNVISVVLSCSLPPSIHVFVPITFIFSFMCTLDIVLLFVTSKKMKERDYIIKQNEICE